MVDKCKLTFFFFNDTATTEIYTLPTRRSSDLGQAGRGAAAARPPDAARHPHAPRPQQANLPSNRRLRPFRPQAGGRPVQDRKSTRLNSSHANISYAVFCLKKKKHSMREHYNCV